MALAVWHQVGGQEGRWQLPRCAETDRHVHRYPSYEYLKDKHQQKPFVMNQRALLYSGFLLSQHGPEGCVQPLNVHLRLIS